MVEYQALCGICKKRYVLTKKGERNRMPICNQCYERQWNQSVDDPKMKKLFDIPIDLYRKSKFLRDIKISYLRYGNLTPAQTKSFKSTVKEMSK